MFTCLFFLFDFLSSSEIGEYTYVIGSAKNDFDNAVFKKLDIQKQD